jgi:hypothetical protein
MTFSIRCSNFKGKIRFGIPDPTFWRTNTKIRICLKKELSHELDWDFDDKNGHI